MCGEQLRYIFHLTAAEVEERGYERHKAEKREQTAQLLGQQPPAAVGEGKIILANCVVMIFVAYGL